MNKDISVQYAYKKDGKGERHGDEAERMLALQAKKHNVLPEIQSMPMGLSLNGAVPQAPAAMLGNDPSQYNAQPPFGGAPQSLPPGFAPPRGPNGYGAVPPPQQQQRQNAPLPPPPTGLPQRPPPSQAGYGGPVDYHPAGFAPPPPQGFQGQMPPGFAPGFPPQGFAPPPGFPVPPPQGPPGFAGRR